MLWIRALAWYDYYISTGKIEEIVNKIKTMKRQALKLYSYLYSITESFIYCEKNNYICITSLII